MVDARSEKSAPKREMQALKKRDRLISISVFPKSLNIALQLACMLAPIFLCVWYIHSNVVNVPFWDDWHFLNGLIKVNTDHQINLTEFINGEGGEFKVPVSRAIIQSIFLATKFNMIATISAEIFFLLLTTTCLFAIAWPVLKRKTAPFLWFSPVLWIIFSIRQWDILLWDGAMPAVVSVFFFVFSVFLLSHSKKVDIWLLTSLVSAILATYSCGSGVLIWPIGFFQIFLQSTFKRILLTPPYTVPIQETVSKNTVKPMTFHWKISWLQLGIWCLVALATLILYTNDLSAGTPEQQQAHLTVSYLKSDFIQVLEFGFACIGSPLSSEPNAAIAIGVLLLALVILSIVSLFQDTSNNKVSVIAPSLLVLFGILITCLCVWGRVRVGLSCALKSYYCVFFNLSIVGLYLLLIAQGRTKTFLWSARMGLLVGLLLIGVMTSLRTGLKEGERIRGARIMFANMVRAYDLQSNESLSQLCDSTEVLRDGIAFLKRNHWSVFAETPPPSVSSIKRSTRAPCFLLESVNFLPSHTYPLQKHIVVDSMKEKTLDFRGWAIDFKSRSPSGAVFVTIDNQLDIPTGLGIPRPDVVGRFRRSTYRNAGFGGTCRVDCIPQGVHTVTLKIVSPDYSEYYQSGPLASLEIR